MRTKLIAILAALMVVTVGIFWGGGSTAKADNGPHKMGQAAATDACAGCHRAHSGKAAYILKASEESICETCHDGSQATTNVLNGVATGGGALRAGGFENAAIQSDDPAVRYGIECPAGTPQTLFGVSGTCSGTTGTGRFRVCAPTAAGPFTDCTAWTATYTGGGESSWVLHIGALTTPEAVTSSHLNLAGLTNLTGTMWGSGAKSTTAFAGQAGVGLECTSCHDPHGNNQYRILRPNPAAQLGITGVGGTFPGGVTVPDACPSGSSTTCNSGNLHSYTTTNYMNATYVTWTTGGTAAPYTDGMAPATTTETGISAWCAQCHQRYLSRGQYATDSGDPVFAFRHSTEGSMGYNGRQCITCHVAHGTNSKATGFVAAEPLPGQPDSGTKENSALLKMDNRGMCEKCHGK